MRHESNCECKSCEMSFEALLLHKREGKKIDMPFDPLPKNKTLGGFKTDDPLWNAANEAYYQLKRDYDSLKEENERFKVMYKGFENQFYEIQRLRDALLKVANWYEDVHDTADFSGDTPSSYAKEFLVRSEVKV